MIFGIAIAAAAMRLHAPVCKSSARPSLKQRSPPFGSPAALKNGALAAGLCTSLLLGEPTGASIVDQAIAEAADASYPILKAASRPETFTPIATRAVDLVLSASPAELTKAIDIGLDLFLSIPADKISATTDILDEASAGCELFPLPSAALVERVTQSSAFAAVDAAKLKAVNAQSLKAVRKLQRDSAVCLPPRASLPALAAAQANALASADEASVAAFRTQIAAALKSIPTSKRVKELPALQTEVVQVGELAERRRFKAALAAIESAQADERKRAAAALAPKVCFTMSCKDYSLDLGADRKIWEESIASGPASKAFGPVSTK